MKNVDGGDIDDILAGIERGHAEARLAALEQLAVLLLHKAGGTVTITAADIEDVAARRAVMVRWPATQSAFRLELFDGDGRPWDTQA